MGIKSLIIAVLIFCAVGILIGWQSGPWQSDRIYYDTVWEGAKIYTVSGSDSTIIDGGDITCVIFTSDTLTIGNILVQVITKTDTITTYADPQVTFREDVMLDSTLTVSGKTYLGDAAGDTVVVLGKVIELPTGVTQIGTGTADTVSITGPVGIGTTTPGAWQLNVNGNSKFVDFVYFQGGSYFDWNASLLSPHITTNAYRPLYISPERGALVLGTRNVGDRTTEAKVVDFGPQGSALSITGNFANQRYYNFWKNTITAASALTVTNAATVYIQDAPTVSGSAIITNPYALWIDDGMVRFNGIVQTQAEIVPVSGADINLDVDALNEEVRLGDTGTAGEYVSVDSVGTITTATTGILIPTTSSARTAAGSIRISGDASADTLWFHDGTDWRHIVAIQ